MTTPQDRFDRHVRSSNRWGYFATALLAVAIILTIVEIAR